MNYKTFMEQIKTHVSKMQKEQLEYFIYEIARTIKESEREDFINKFTKYDSFDRSKEIEQINIFCDKLENLEYYFCCTSYEDYNSGFWDSDWVYEYTDPQGIGTNLEEAFLLAENLLYEKKYSEACELYDRLIYLEIPVYYEDTEEMDHEGLGIEDVVNEKLVDIDLIDVCSYILYTIFQTTEGNNRILSIYHMFHNVAFKEVPLESMFSIGPEPINEIEEFMISFHEFLMTKKGDLESRLLKETLPYIKDDIIKIARKSASIYPSIYYDLCREALKEEQFDKVIEIGEDAFKYIPSNLTIRSEVAYIVAKAYKNRNDNVGYKKCLIERFVSDSSPVNFLNLFTVCDKTEIIEMFNKMKNTSLQMEEQLNLVVTELSVNNISSMHKFVIRFFSGDYDYIKSECKVDKNHLGWSQSLKGLSIPLFLILLENGNTNSKAKIKILKNIKSRLGIYSESQLTSDFEEMILCWKTKIPLLNHRKDYIEWVQDEVEKRVEAIVGGGYRKSYYKAAELIVYLGQVLESNGEIEATTRLVDKYRKVYSRKSAFKSELKDLL